jgi:hypothetical protein
MVLDAAHLSKRKAWDNQDPTQEELDLELSPDECLEMVKRMMDNMDSQERKQLCDMLVELSSTDEIEQGVDTRSARRAHTATRAHRAGDRRRLAGDAMPRGVRPAHERFPGLARVTSIG